MSDDQMSNDQHFAMDLIAGGQRADTNDRLKNIESLLAAQQANVVAKCPYCDGDLSKIGVEICKHCTKELLWYEGFVYKEGELEQVKAKVSHLKKIKEERRERIIELQDELKRLTPKQKLKNVEMLWLYFGGAGFMAVLGLLAMGFPGDASSIFFGIAILILTVGTLASISMNGNPLDSNEKKRIEEEIEQLRL